MSLRIKMEQQLEAIERGVVVLNIKSQKELSDTNRQHEDSKANEVRPENSIGESFSSNQSIFDKLEDFVVTLQNDLVTIPATNILIMHFELIQI